MSFYNTLTIKLNNSDEHLSFLITIYETIGLDDQEGPSHYFGLHPNIIMRKVDITGDKEEAIKYLKKNKLDYTEIAPEDYNGEYFRRKDH